MYKDGMMICSFLLVVLTTCLWHVSTKPQIACGFLGSFLVHIAAERSWRQLRSVAFFGASAAVVYGLINPVFSPLETLLAFLGVGSILTLLSEIIYQDRDDLCLIVRDTILMPLFTLGAGIILGVLMVGNTTHYDNWLYAFDSRIGVTPSRDIAGLFGRFPMVKRFAELIYKGVLLFPPLFHAWAIFRKRKVSFNPIVVFVIASAVGAGMFQICPAMGPIYAYTDLWPNQLPAYVPLEVITTPGLDNAIPSLHMTWALLVLLFSCEIGPAAVGAAAIIVLFTGLATVGFGEHYLIDLFMSVPTVMAGIGLYAGRRVLVATSCGLILAWLLLLRSGILLAFDRLVLWLMLIATAVMCLAVYKLHVMVSDKFQSLADVDQDSPARRFLVGINQES